MTAARHYIDGRWVRGSGPAFQSTDPATGQVTWDGPAATDEQVNQAVGAAGGAFERWAGLPLAQRIEFIRSYGQQLIENKEPLAVTISRDTGKPLWESRTEVGAMIGKIDLSIQAYAERCHVVSYDLHGATGMTRFKPHGICAVLGPFNLPAHLPNGHIIPALLAGNTVVFKPSELAAAVAHHMLLLWEAAALPAGVINMVQGGRDTGVSLSRNTNLDGLFFTGSYTAGRSLSQVFAAYPQKILALEMGGNNPLVVWGAGDPEAAAYLTVQSAFITAGQRCTCARRLIVSDNETGKVFMARLTELVACIRTGPYTHRPEPFMGPVINDAAADRLLDAQRRLVQQGGRCLVRWSVHQTQPPC